MESKGKKVVQTREPGWGKLGKQIREIILDDESIEIEPFAELCLFCADRAQHVKEFIKPNLDAGKIVICDRYSDSTFIYQGYGRQLDINQVKQMADASRLNIVPDITFFLSLPAEVGLKRLQKRDEITKMDNEPVEFHKRILQGYKRLAETETDRFVVINADDTIEQIHKDIINSLKNKI